MGSTFFERVIDDVTCDTLGITEYQCGGKRGRGTVDNMIMMRAVVDSNERINKKIYCYFADA